MPDAPWCVFVSGSRDLDHTHAGLIEEKLRRLYVKGSVLIHGQGEGRGFTSRLGCDLMAETIGRRLGFAAYGFPALWELQGKKAGPIRSHLCCQIWNEHGSHGYRLAGLAFSTGGPGTERAFAMMQRVQKAREMDITCRLIVQLEKIVVTLEERTGP